MKLILSSLLLPLLAAAAPARVPDKFPFTVLASRPHSPIHFLPMTADGLGLYLGGKTYSYCPKIPNLKCPPAGGQQTVFAPSGYAMNDEVPGGQQVYVGPHGALRYTQAHSAYIPPGSSLGPFHHEHEPGNPVGHYTYTGWNANGFTACPTKNHRWRVFADIRNATVPSGNIMDCLSFKALAVPYSKHQAAVWQYT